VHGNTVVSIGCLSVTDGPVVDSMKISMKLARTVSR
jgi:hypothetical protein